MKIYSVDYYANLLKENNLLVKANIVSNKNIESITYDSKETKEFTLFACKGVAFKEDYLNQSIDNGIACYLSEVEYSTSIDYLIVNDIRKAMALVADVFYDKAYQKLKLIGLTGTKGKSTTAYYIKYILDEYLESIGEKPTGILSSIDKYDGVIFEESTLTTPESFVLHKHFHNAVNSGLKYFVMEVSSQALKYDRVNYVEFDVTAFLNISEDHISPIEHSDFADYFSSKLKLFSMTKNAIINLDCDCITEIIESSKKCPNVYGFSFDESKYNLPDTKIKAMNLRKENNLTCFSIQSNEFDSLKETQDFALSMSGLFNGENAVTAIAITTILEIPLEFIKKGLLKARSKGRMELFSNKTKDIVAIVDYAHNKLSFEKLYQSTIEEYKGWEIITVFGCPGGKAYNRREELGLLSGKYSTKVYLTNEDCGYDDVEEINEQIQQFILKANKDCECYSIYDRGEAIKTAIENASKNTVILITGKGAETRQKIKSEYVPCRSDIDYVEEYI